MKLKYFFALVIAFTTSLAFAGKHDHSALLKKCTKECPGATKKTLSKCLEEKEKDPAFKETACGIAHAKHEKEEKEEESHGH